MMSFVFTADWHIHPWRECSRDGGQDRLRDGLEAGRQILRACQERRCPLVHGGDWKELKDRWIVSVQNGLLALLEEFPDVNVWSVSGNHDGRALGRDGLAALAKMPNFRLFAEPAVERVPWAKEPVAFWPWQPTLDDLPAFLESARRVKARLLVAHVFLSGAALGSDEVRLPRGATLEQFGLVGKGRVFDWAFLGDVHKAQVMTGTLMRRPGTRPLLPFVVYPGGPLAKDWGERELNKGALFVDLEKGTVEPVLVKAPRFRLVDWTDISARGGDVNKTLEANARSPEVAAWAGDFVRLIVGPWADARLLERLREASGARAFQVIARREAPVARRADLHAGMASDQLLAKYVAARPVEGLDPKALLAVGQRLAGGGADVV